MTDSAKSASHMKRCYLQSAPGAFVTSTVQVKPPSILEAKLCYLDVPFITAPPDTSNLSTAVAAGVATYD